MELLEFCTKPSVYAYAIYNKVVYYFVSTGGPLINVRYVNLINTNGRGSYAVSFDKMMPALILSPAGHHQLTTAPSTWNACHALTGQPISKYRNTK